MFKSSGGIGDLFIKMLCIVTLITVNLDAQQHIKGYEKVCRTNNDYRVVSIQISTNTSKD